MARPGARHAAETRYGSHALVVQPCAALLTAIAGAPRRPVYSQSVPRVGCAVGNGAGALWCGSTRGSEASNTHRGVFVYRHDPRCGTQRISFCQGAHGALENRPVCILAVGRGTVAQGLTTPSSFAMGLQCTVATTMLDYTPCCRGLPIA